MINRDDKKYGRFDLPYFYEKVLNFKSWFVQEAPVAKVCAGGEASVKHKLNLIYEIDFIKIL